MSSSIQIPQRRSARPTPSTPVNHSTTAAGSASSSDFSLSSSAGSSARGAELGSYYAHQRSPSFLSAAFSKAEHTVVNIGHPDAPRLITCLKASQGFDWNPDIFLPSYAERDSSELEHRQDPVTDIILTDEEAAAYLPS